MTPEEIKSEMQKTKIPSFIKFAERFWFKAGRWVLYLGILAFIPLLILYNNISYQYTDLLWNIMIGFFLFLMFGIGGLMLVSHLFENAFVKKQAKRLGISVEVWNMYANDLDLKSN